MSPSLGDVRNVSFCTRLDPQAGIDQLYPHVDICIEQMLKVDSYVISSDKWGRYPVIAPKLVSSSTKLPASCSSFQVGPRAVPTTLLVLPDDILLRTPLRSLPVIMPNSRSFLRLPIPDHAGHSTTDSTLNPLPQPGAIILQLALGFLPFPFRILLLTFPLQTLGSKCVPDGFFGSTDGLIVGALGARRVVFCDSAGGGDGYGA